MGAETTALDRIRMAINVKEKGLLGDDSANDATALNTLITAIGSTPTHLYLPSGTYRIGTNVVLPSNIKLIPAMGAVLKPLNGVSITGTNTKLRAGLYKIFDLGLGGTLAGTWDANEVYPEWFGAVGDGTSHTISSLYSDTTLAVVQALDATATLSSEADWYGISLAVKFSRDTKIKLKMLANSYMCYNIVTIDNAINIDCDMGCQINTANTALIIKSKDVRIKGYPIFYITSDTSDSIVKMMTPSYGGDLTHMLNDIELNFDSASLRSCTAIEFMNSGTWASKYRFDIRNCTTGVKIGGTGWHNGNTYEGRIRTFVTAFHVCDTVRCISNNTRMEIEQTLNNTSYGFKVTETAAWNTSRMDNNIYLDGTESKLYPYYIESELIYYFKNNHIRGQVEGTCYPDYPFKERNLWSIYYTRRDRSLIPSDSVGGFNQLIINNHKHINLLANGSMSMGSAVPVGVTAYGNITIETDTSIVYRGKQSLKITKLDSASGYAVMLVYPFEHLKGRRVSMVGYLYSPSTNKRDDYAIYLNDGIASSAGSMMAKPIDGIWQRVEISMVIAANATSVGVNIGRWANPGTGVDGTGDVIYASDIMVYEGEYISQDFVPYIEDQPRIIWESQSYAFPTADESLRGKLLRKFRTTGNSDETYICSKNSDESYSWYLIPKVLAGSATFDAVSMTPGQQESTTVTVTGAALGDFVVASLSVSLAGIRMDAYVSSANTVTVTLFNATNTTIDLASATLRAKITKQ